MKSQIVRMAALVSLMMLVTACPYQSKVPVSEPNEKLDKKLFGEWVSAADLELEQPTYYKIGKFSKTKYDLKEYTYSSYDSVYTENQYWMHSSKVGDRVFMNIESANSTDGYYIYCIEKGDNEITMLEMSENVDEQFTASAELKKFIEKNMELSFFYSKAETKYIKRTKK